MPTPTVPTETATLETIPNLSPDFRFVDVFVVDINGNLLGKRLPATDLRQAATGGVPFSACAPVLDARGMNHNAGGLGGDDGDPDGIGWPLLPTLLSVPWATAPTAQCLLEMREAKSGAPFWYDPRTILRDVVDLCHANGLLPVVACELEFYLTDPKRTPEGGIVPPVLPRTNDRQRVASNLSIEQVEEYSGVLSAMVDACAVQGLGAGAVVAEYGIAQFEINLSHSADPLRAADNAVLLRRLVKGVARAHGFEATFMAKPYVDQPGNGFHVHVSMADETGANRFGGRDGEALMGSAIAGMQMLHAESMAIFAASFGAYRRYARNLFVPMNSHWGENNRSVAFRVPTARGAGRRVEHRVAGADASPHLVMAAILAAVHHGLTEKLTATAPVNGNVGDHPDLDLPRDLQSALTRLRGASRLAEYIPQRFLDLYADVKQAELTDLFAAVTAREYDFYL